MYLPADFFRQYGPAVIEATAGTNIFPSVKAAQMALETGYGRSKVGNNMFGIKATGAHSPYWKGALVSAETTEVTAGQAARLQQPFRQYASVADSIRDHSYFLLANPRYRKAGVFSAKTPADQARALQAAGYATDPGYADKLISIINRYGLTSLDEKKKCMKMVETAGALALIALAVWLLYKNWL